MKNSRDKLLMTKQRKKNKPPKKSHSELSLEPLEKRVLLSVMDDLRITELMYNPAEPPNASIHNNNDFEFIELKNIGNSTIDLLDVSFVEVVYNPDAPILDQVAEGITFAFAGSNVTALNICAR